MKIVSNCTDPQYLIQTSNNSTFNVTILGSVESVFTQGTYTGSVWKGVNMFKGVKVRFAVFV